MMKIKLKKFYLIIIIALIVTPLILFWIYRLYKVIDLSFLSGNRLEKIERKLYKILDQYNISYMPHDSARTLKGKMAHPGLAEIFQVLEEIKYAPQSDLEPLYQQLKVLMRKLKF